MSAMSLQSIAQGLHGCTTPSGISLQAEMMSADDDMEMVQVVVEDREEFPIFISQDDEQILCTSYLWREKEVKQDSRSEMLEAMISMNVPMPLSSFGKVGDQYLVFGAMANTSSLADIQLEVETLSDNALGAIEAMQDFLIA